MDEEVFEDEANRTLIIIVGVRLVVAAVVGVTVIPSSALLFDIYDVDGGTHHDPSKRFVVLLCL